MFGSMGEMVSPSSPLSRANGKPWPSPDSILSFVSVKEYALLTKSIEKPR